MEIKQLIKQIKKRLVKKVVLEDISRENGFLILSLRLRNFISLKKEIRLTLTAEQQNEEIPFQLDNNHLVARISDDLLKDCEKATIPLKINHEPMWITADDALDYENIIINNKYFVIRVGDGIHFYEQFHEFQFATEKIAISDLQADYDTISFSLGEMSQPVAIQDMKIVALQRNKIHYVDTEYDETQKRFQLKDLHLFSGGKWGFFIRVDQVLYALSSGEVGKIVTCETKNHTIQFESKQGVLYGDFQAHLLQVSGLSVSLQEDQSFILRFQASQLPVEKENYLIVDNTSTDERKEYILSLKHDKMWEVTIPIEALNEDYFDKRFFVVTTGEQPILYQFNLAKRNRVTFSVPFHSQQNRMTFYRRKDRSLGLKLRKPSFRKLITEINGLRVKGSHGSLDRFMNCQAELVLEDRNSLESMAIPIPKVFDIDLSKQALIPLKSKGKTILDIYLQLTDKDSGEIIRKEKVKYDKADYKKDNYYGHVVLEDENQDQHHFLVTTTPFHNVKIESFVIPGELEIPDDLIKKDEKIWLIGERYNTAQDNGIALFHWLREHTDIEAYYVIEEDAEDYQRVKDIPNVLRFGSKEHYEIAFKAKVLLGTHDLENLLPYKPAKGFFHYEDTLKVFLQHGVLGRKNVEYNKNYYEDPFDLFIVSSEPEKYDVVMDQLGYEAEDVAVTGLARFDHLISSDVRNEILLMPTWRDWINTDQQFLASEYYQAYSSFITSPRLMELLEKYDAKLNFYPHYRAQDFFKRDLPEQNDRIHFIELGKETVQDLLKRHALLITDYSSVSFDFTLMKKPVVYYHFDVKRFFRKGILRPIEETFIGGIAHREEELLNLLEERLTNHFYQEDLDITGMIRYQDTQNCERIYRAVLEKLH